MPKLLFTSEAKRVLKELESPNYQRKLKKVRKALGHLERDPRHPSLQSHKYSSIKGPEDSDVWESYVENHTPGAWRIFWQYRPGDRSTISVLTIGPHPD